MLKPNAEKLMKEYDLSGVIVFGFDDDGSTYYSFCGTNPQRCDDMQSLMDEFLRQIGDAEVTAWSEGDGK